MNVQIAASFEGIPQNDVGQRTDVLDLAPKKSRYDTRFKSDVT